jgi:glycosyltransferase involved in cell wall biosynthesis
MPQGQGRSRPKVAVVAWDVGHNPLGRAHLLADLLRDRFEVEIWGAQFERYGARVWAPLRDSELPIHVFDGRRFPAHLTVMEDVALQIDADAIWVSKPRLPSYALGVLAKMERNRPLVLDVDDDELAFFDESSPLQLAELERRCRRLDLSLPFERAWTRAAVGLIGAADERTVSNATLQRRHGGLVVPHARDEAVFDPERYDREQVRHRLGLRPDDRLLLFGGTPRAHKGILTVLQALERLGDERCRLAVFGAASLRELRSEIGALERWLHVLPIQRFDELAPVVGAADLACVLQDPGHRVSRHQMPAKVTDALAMGVPLLVSDVAPLRPLIDEGVVHVAHEPDPLHEQIERILNEPDDRAIRGRQVFLRDHSYGAVRPSVSGLFERVLADPQPLRPELGELVQVVRRVCPDAGRAVTPTPRVPGLGRRGAPGQQLDLVMFWKQNDSGIYGRRQDMLLEHLARSGRFGTIVHFDNPVTPEALVMLAARALGGGGDQTRLVLRQTLGRLVRRGRGSGIHRHTYLYAGRRTRRLGLPRRDEYVTHVRSVLERHRIGARPTVLWVYPSNFDFPAIADALDPDIIVADVVDDSRTWHPEGSVDRDRVDRNHEEILRRADLVLANCEAVAESMRRFVSDVHVVPNGCDLTVAPSTVRRPAVLRRIPGPIIGYAGNLSSRLDLALLETVVAARPQWSFVFIGSTHLDRQILRLDEHPNVHFLGVHPYEEAKRLIEHFDVGLIPHVDDEMTRSMNPLKAFVYAAAGVPVVSTPVANLEDLGEIITVASGPDQFIEAIEAALERGRTSDRLALAPHRWSERVEDVLRLIDGMITAGA